MSVSHDTRARYARQMVLPEVGEGGQARIGAARVVVRARGLEAEVACLYARAAGFAEVAADERSPAAASPPFDAYDDHVRAVASGAYRALVLMRDAIGLHEKAR